MADNTAGSFSGIPDFAKFRDCRVAKMLTCGLAAFAGAAAVAVFASFFPRGHRGRRRLPRQRPWNRLWIEALPVERQEDRVRS